MVERGFPGTIAYNGRSTGDEVVQVQVAKTDDNLMSRMLLTKGLHPQWWLEGGSFPIRVLDETKVEVLASSKQMASRYRAAPVVVRVRWEDGEIIHVVSHFYRQMKTQGVKVAAKAVANQMEGLTAKDKAELQQSASGEANAGDVASSYAFQRMTTNLVTGKQKQNQVLDKLYNLTVDAEAQPRAAPTADAPAVARIPAGRRMRVLEERGELSKVRDESGNEGWMKSADLRKVRGGRR